VARASGHRRSTRCRDRLPAAEEVWALQHFSELQPEGGVGSGSGSANCGRNFLQKAHCFTLSPSMTLESLAWRCSTSLFMGVCSGQ